MKAFKLIVMVGVLVITVTAFSQSSEISGERAEASKAVTAEKGIQVTPDRWNDLGSVLLVFLVLSVVFETAMTPIFNWRVFLARFEGKGIKTPVVTVLAFIVFWRYDLDIVNQLLNALGVKSSMNFGGQMLSALLIAGGSDGIFRIFTKLGIRNPTERREKAAETKAEAARVTAEEKAAEKSPKKKKVAVDQAAGTPG